jgi:regulatory protein
VQLFFLFPGMKNTPSLKARALRYLAARDYSKKELVDKLLRFAQEGDDVDALLAWLEAQGFLSEARFAESLVHRRAERYGNGRIRQELRNHQVMDALSGDAMTALMESEASRARAVWVRKFGKMPTDARERARQMRFLQQRGFSSDAIRQVFSARADWLQAAE